MRMGGLAAVAVMAAFIGFSAAAAGERSLHIYTWSDYIAPEVVVSFEEEHNCRVVIDYFDSNEAMYAKLKAGATGYDLITPSSYMSAVMRKQGMLLALDHARLPHLGNMDRGFTRFTEDPDMEYSVPYTRTVSGVGYNKEKVPEPGNSWNIFARADLAKRMTMLNDMRETMGAALLYLGHSLNSTDDAELAAAGDQIIAWKRNLAKFDVDEAKIGLGSGEFYVIHGYNGDIGLVMQENPDIGFFVPAEGSSLASDDFVIPTGSDNADLAHAFINFVLEPDVARMNMEFIRYYMPNPAAVELLNAELRESPAFDVPASILEKCEVIRDLGPDNAKYVKVWERIKAAE